MASVKDTAKSSMGPKLLIGFLGLSTIGLLTSTIILGTKKDKVVTEVVVVKELNVPNAIDSKSASTFFKDGVNTCAGKKLYLANEECSVKDDTVHVPGPQAGANVTKGYKGELEAGTVPNTNTFFSSKMCPVNVHWHLGTEHYSVGEYDEKGSSPHGSRDLDDWAKRNLGTSERAGFRCHHYDAEKAMFTEKYDWQHCKGMEVGETYEVHWPHSAAGACHTTNQYQTPFYDGLFCNLDAEGFGGLSAQDLTNAVGVQGQIFTIVNDESFYYPDLMRGMVVDTEMTMGTDVTYYTGSSTGTKRNNTMCSAYTPITWQVDRKCHMISASSFDKLCYDMKTQRDDMSDDLHAHGARELVKHEFVADNQDYGSRHHRHLWADGNNNLHEDEHYEAATRNLRHSHGHDHGDDHQHDEWF